MAELKYFIRTALRNLWELKVTTLFTLVTLSVAFGFLGAYLAIFINMKTALGVMTEKFPLTVYMKDGATTEQLDAVRSRLGDAAVSSYEYTSKDKALELFRSSLGDNAPVLDNLGGNPLPASFDISLKAETEAGAADRLIAELGKLPGVDEVQYLKDEASKLRSLLGSFRSAGMGLGLGVLLGVVFISYSTLRLAVLNHLDEIGALKLMGATRLFVMAPFLIEGAIQGFFAAVLSLGLLFGLLKAFSGASAMLLLAPTGLSFLPVWAWAGMTLAGGLLGMTGSFFAFGRTLRM